MAKQFNKTEKNIEEVAEWLLETSSVYYDNAIEDSAELLEHHPKEFFEILKQNNLNFRDIAFDYIQRKASNGCQEAIEIMEHLEK